MVENWLVTSTAADARDPLPFAALVVCCNVICAPVVPLRTHKPFTHTRGWTSSCCKVLETMVKTLTYHVFHIRGRGEHPSPHFVVVIKNCQHVVLADVAPFPYLGRGVRSVALRRAETGEIERGHRGDTRPQRTCSTRRAQQHDQ